MSELPRWSLLHGTHVHYLNCTWPLRHKELTLAYSPTCLPVSCGMPLATSASFRWSSMRKWRNCIFMLTGRRSSRLYEYEHVFHSICNLPPPPTSYARALCCLLPLTGAPTYTQKSRGGHPRCDLAPVTTSFGTVGQWERQHLAMSVTCPEGEAWAACRGRTSCGTPERLRPSIHREQCRTCHLPRLTLVRCSGRTRRMDLTQHVGVRMDTKVALPGYRYATRLYSARPFWFNESS